VPDQKLLNEARTKLNELGVNLEGKTEVQTIAMFSVLEHMGEKPSKVMLDKVLKMLEEVERDADE
jgi:hypothetical protein